MWFSFGVFKGPLTSERCLCNTKYPNSTVQVFWGRLNNRAGPLFRRFLAVLNKLTIKSKCLSIMIARVRPARTWVLTNNALLFEACTTHAMAQRNVTLPWKIFPGISLYSPVFVVKSSLLHWSWFLSLWSSCLQPVLQRLCFSRAPLLNYENKELQNASVLPVKHNNALCLGWKALGVFTSRSLPKITILESVDFNQVILVVAVQQREWNKTTMSTTRSLKVLKDLGTSACNRQQFYH